VRARRPRSGCIACCWSFPGLAKRFLSAQQARKLIATIKPRDIVGKTRRRLAVDLIGELEGIDKKIKTTEKDLKELVPARGSTLMDLTGIGPAGAARLLADVGDIRRFADRDRFASWNGTAPLDASSGEQIRHRLSRSGNRRINPTLYIMAIVQLRNPTEGRRYYNGRRAAGGPRWKPRDPSNAACPMWCSRRWSPTRNDAKRRTREGTGERLLTPA